MPTDTESILHNHLLHRRRGLEAAIAHRPNAAYLVTLLQQVDGALERIDNGTYGICDVCHEPIGEKTLRFDPLMRICLDHLSEEQRRAIERDLELASQIQGTLLPKRQVDAAGWEIRYRYEPAGPVSGDYCDLISTGNDDEMLFLLGDVTGKGVAASLLMSHLHAIFRSLNVAELRVHDLVAKANQIFSASALSGHFATLVCGRIARSGEMQLCNAGHCPPLLRSQGEVRLLESTGPPIGLFDQGEYALSELHLTKGDTLFLYTDGLSESQNSRNEEFGTTRLLTLLGEHGGLAPDALLDRCLGEAKAFRQEAPRADDLTAMVVRRTA